MKGIQRNQKAIITMLAVVAFTLVCGCSGGSKDLTKDVSGSWQRAEGDGTVDINLVKDPLSVTVDGKTYPATITKVDNGSYSLHIAVENGAGQPEEWILRQVWSDNGSDYTLAFSHNGTHERLVPKKAS